MRGVARYVRMVATTAIKRMTLIINLAMALGLVFLVYMAPIVVTLLLFGEWRH